MPKAINSCALTSIKPCTNKESHTQCMHRPMAFYMQDSGQYSMSTEEASVKFAAEAIDKTVRVVQIWIL